MQSPVALRTRVTACDVGQGDAILVQHGPWSMLIDTGPDSGVLSCLHQKLPWWRRRVDVLVLTHSDWDHIGGTEAVLHSFRVGEVWRTSWTELGVSGQRVEAALSSFTQRRVRAGESLTIPGMRWRVTWGENSYETLSPDVDLEDIPNNRSVGLWAVGQSFGFLSLGDLECPGELAVMQSSLLNNVKILKASHHGSKSSSCYDFLTQLRPETVLISSGEGNSYGHPHPLPLENMARTGVFPLRTDRLGTFSLERNKRSGRYQIQVEASVR